MEVNPVGSIFGRAYSHRRLQPALTLPAGIVLLRMASEEMTGGIAANPPSFVRLRARGTPGSPRGP